MGENDNISIEFDMRQLKPSLDNLRADQSTRENLNIATIMKQDDSRKLKIEKMNRTQLKNQFNISSIFKSHYKKQDKSAEPPKKQSVPSNNTNSKQQVAKMRAKVERAKGGSRTIDLKTHHLHNRSNTQAILMDIA